ncbi:hypothetical protein Tco_0053049 [Tanacetum coccineum]
MGECRITSVDGNDLRGVSIFEETISASSKFAIGEWRGIANMDFIKLGCSSRVLSDFAEKYGSKNRVLAGFGIGGKSGKEKVYKLGCVTERGWKLN